MCACEWETWMGWSLCLRVVWQGLWVAILCMGMWESKRNWYECSRLIVISIFYWRKALDCFCCSCRSRQELIISISPPRIPRTRTENGCILPRVWMDCRRKLSYTWLPVDWLISDEICCIERFECDAYVLALFVARSLWLRKSFYCLFFFFLLLDGIENWRNYLKV